MSKLSPVPLIVGLFAILAIACGGFGSKPVGVTAYKQNLEIEEYAKRDTRPPITQPKEEDIKKTGTKEWNSGRKTEPQPKALEKEFMVRGKVSANGGNSITVTVDGGGQKTFQTDVNTFVFRSGDSRFFKQELASAGEGSTVSVIGYNKNGQDYASSISIGEGGFIAPKGGNK
jgi:hypothetical protein